MATRTKQLPKDLEQARALVQQREAELREVSGAEAVLEDMLRRRAELQAQLGADGTDSTASMIETIEEQSRLDRDIAVRQESLGRVAGPARRRLAEARDHLTTAARQHYATEARERYQELERLLQQAFEVVLSLDELRLQLGAEFGVGIRDWRVATLHTSVATAASCSEVSIDDRPVNVQVWLQRRSA